MAASPKKGLSRKLIAIILIAVVLVGGGAYFLLSGPNRHGLPGNMPLPSGATFKLMMDVDSMTQAWYWTVDSPNNPTALADFYKSNLASNGWTDIETRGSTELGAFEVVGCQWKQEVDIVIGSSFDVSTTQSNSTMKITAPSGGSAMKIVVSSNPDQAFGVTCS